MTHDGVILQLVAIDLVQLNSDVVVVYQEKNIAVFSTINKQPIAFYHHTTVSAGVKQGLWQKVGKGPLPHLTSLVFKQYFDKDDVETLNEFPDNLFRKIVKVKPHYTYWHVGEDVWHKMSESKGKQLKAENGDVVPPLTILERINRDEDSLRPIKMRDFSIENVVETGRRTKHLGKIEVGDNIKAVLKILRPPTSIETERLWFKVVDIQENKIIATLDNDPVYVQSIGDSDKISFVESEILEVLR